MPKFKQVLQYKRHADYKSNYRKKKLSHQTLVSLFLNKENKSIYEYLEHLKKNTFKHKSPKE